MRQIGVRGLRANGLKARIGLDLCRLVCSSPRSGTFPILYQCRTNDDWLVGDQMIAAKFCVGNVGYAPNDVYKAGSGTCYAFLVGEVGFEFLVVDLVCRFHHRNTGRQEGI